MNRRLKEQASEHDPYLLKVLEGAAQSLGWFLPETPEEVLEWERAETRPETHEFAKKTLTFRSEDDVEESSKVEEQLARAAREGTGEISAEAEEAMRRDRDRAEHEKS